MPAAIRHANLRRVRKLRIAAERGDGPGVCRRVSATAAEQSALGPVGLRLVAVIAFWWEDWPGFRLRPRIVGTHRHLPDRRQLAVQNVVNLRSLVARLHESFNDRDLDAWSEVFDDEVELVVDGAAFRGVAAARAYLAAVFREFPRLRIHGARVVAESGDTIVVEHQIRNGDPSLGPLRPQGSVCEIYRVRDGRVVAYRSYYAAEGADRDDVVKVPWRAEGSKMAEEQAADEQAADEDRG